MQIHVHLPPPIERPSKKKRSNILSTTVRISSIVVRVKRMCSCRTLFSLRFSQTFSVDIDSLSQNMIVARFRNAQYVNRKFDSVHSVCRFCFDMRIAAVFPRYILSSSLVCSPARPLTLSFIFLSMQISIFDNLLQERC